MRAEELERVRQNQTQATEAAVAAAVEGILRFGAVVGMGVMREADSPFIKALREMERSPMAKALREAQAREAPFIKALREMERSPMAKALREAQAREAPFIKALREMA